jgi:hypothetical protein
MADGAALVRAHGVLLESARGPIPNLAELVAGTPIKGSWWSHPASHAIFAAINQAVDSPDVARLRLLNGKITLVHRRVWPALVRLSERFPLSALASRREEHTPSGAHRATEVAFPSWVPADVVDAAAALTEEDALALLPTCLRLGPRASRDELTR